MKEQLSQITNIITWLSIIVALQGGNWCSANTNISPSMTNIKLSVQNKCLGLFKDHSHAVLLFSK